MLIEAYCVARTLPSDPLTHSLFSRMPLSSLATCKASSFFLDILTLRHPVLSATIKKSCPFSIITYKNKIQKGFFFIMYFEISNYKWKMGKIYLNLQLREYQKDLEYRLHHHSGLSYPIKTVKIIGWFRLCTVLSN